MFNDEKSVTLSIAYLIWKGSYNSIRTADQSDKQYSISDLERKL